MQNEFILNFISDIYIKNNAKNEFVLFAGKFEIFTHGINLKSLFLIKSALRYEYLCLLIQKLNELCYKNGRKCRDLFYSAKFFYIFFLQKKLLFTTTC
jgi:hypothetical protein